MHRHAGRGGPRSQTEVMPPLVLKAAQCEVSAFEHSTTGRHKTMARHAGRTASAHHGFAGDAQRLVTAEELVNLRIENHDFSLTEN